MSMLHLMAEPRRSLPDVADLFDSHGAELLRYCTGRVGPTVAEDVVADTFLIAHQRRHRLADGPARAWLYGIASNLLRRHRRSETRALRALARTGRDLDLTDIADGAAARADASALTRRLAAVLAALPARQRDVLLLYAVAELGYEEIARTLDIPLGSVQSALHRARVKLRAALAADPAAHASPDGGSR